MNRSLRTRELSSIQKLQDQWTEPHELHLSVAFSANDETRHKIRLLLRETILRIQELVEKCTIPDEVSRIILDLY